MIIYNTFGNIVLVLLALALATWFAAAIGAGGIVFIKKADGPTANLILGLAAGVVLAVSFTELLQPAIHMAETHSPAPAWLVVPGAFALGFLCTLLLDVCITRIKKAREKSGKPGLAYKKGIVLINAFAFHNIPEGFALGVFLGGAALGGFNILSAIPIIVAIALHKIPEGAAISVAFQSEGMATPGSFLRGQIPGFIGFIFGIIGLQLAINYNAVLPYAMAFAAGAMIWVAVHELIPTGRGCGCNKRHPYLTSAGIFLGVMLMLVLHTTIHDHSYHGHHHEHHYENCHNHHG